MKTTADADELLRRYWGHECLRPAQRKAIEAVLAARDTLAILPTGGGKSVCYQIPALLLDGVTLVVSPLIALMEDQVKALSRKGIPAACINSSLPASEIALRLDQAANGALKLLYLTPERIATESFARMARYLPVSLLAVDEAHCISQWGHDFRPTYREIVRARDFFPAPTIALTATATRQTAADICRSLRFSEDFQVVRESFRRENISYQVVENESVATELLELLREDPQGCAIVYCGTRAEVLATARMLEENGISAGEYHAGLSAAIRSRALRKWIEGEKRIMVATNAFGMGIDKADVRLVVHRYIPPSPEDYFQQAGRAGRDGRPSRAVILYDRKAIATLRRRSTSGIAPEEVLKVYRLLCAYCGLGEGEAPEGKYAFSPEDFFPRCPLPEAEVREALDTLVRTGILVFPDGENLVPRVRILASPEECRQLDRGVAARALEALTRSCEGIFSYPCPIDPQQVASLAEASVQDFLEALERLSEWKMIEYFPAKRFRPLYFCSSRCDRAVGKLLERTIRLSAARRKERVEKMEDYLRTRECRARWIELYFGEDRPDDCRVCDNCLKSLRGSTPLEQALCGKSLSAKALAEATGMSLEQTIEVLRERMDAGVVEFDGRGKFSLTKNARPPRGGIR